MPDDTQAPWFGCFKRTRWQVGQLGHAQVSNGDEVLCVLEPASRPLGLLQQPIHGLHIGIGPGLQHPRHHTIPMRFQCVGQPLERLKS